MILLLTKTMQSSEIPDIEYETALPSRRGTRVGRIFTDLRLSAFICGLYLVEK